MANKSEPFSLRLSAETDALIEAEARRTRRSKGAVIEALAEEALKMRLFPGIAFRGEDWERRAWIIGTALDVWQVVDALRDFGSIDRMVRRSDLSERQIRLAAAYAERFPDDVDGFIEENRRSLAQILRENPMIDVPSRKR